MENDEQWDKLLIKYAVRYCYDEKEKFAMLSPDDLDDLEQTIFDNMQKIKDKELQRFI